MLHAAVLPRKAIPSLRRTPAAHRILCPIHAIPTYRAKNSVKHWRNTQAPGFQRLQRPEHISFPSIGRNPSAKHSTVHGRVHDSCVSARLLRLVRSSFPKPQSHRQRITAASLEQPFVSSHASQVFPAFPESVGGVAGGAYDRPNKGIRTPIIYPLHAWRASK